MMNYKRNRLAVR